MPLLYVDVDLLTVLFPALQNLAKTEQDEFWHNTTFFHLSRDLNLYLYTLLCMPKLRYIIEISNFL